MSVDDLRAVVATLPVIEQAKGMLMGYYGIGPETAFHLLTRWSQNRNIKLQRVCTDLVEAAARPDPAPFGELQRYLRSQGLAIRS